MARIFARRGGARGGFALLITVMLLGLTVLLLLSLVTLTRVETAVAVNTQEAARARESALMGLHLAVGRLQRFAGPDQRVTARADLLPEGGGNPYWTGVWDATTAAPAPFTWLVSGNEVQPPVSAVPLDREFSALGTKGPRSTVRQKGPRHGPGRRPRADPPPAATGGANGTE